VKQFWWSGIGATLCALVFIVLLFFYVGWMIAESTG
jgi:hypothetical protein